MAQMRKRFDKKPKETVENLWHNSLGNKQLQYTYCPSFQEVKASSRLVSDFFLFLEKSLYEEKASGLKLSFNVLRQPSTSKYIRNKLYKTLDNWSRDTLNFDFLKKCLGQVFPSNFVYDFSRKMFFILHYINWPIFLVWLPLLLEMLGNTYIVIICLPGCYVRNLENFSIWLTKSKQKFKYHQNKKNF